MAHCMLQRSLVEKLAPRNETKRTRLIGNKMERFGNTEKEVCVNKFLMLLL
jgi:hypothetical protein